MAPIHSNPKWTPSPDLWQFLRLNTISRGTGPKGKEYFGLRLGERALCEIWTQNLDNLFISIIFHYLKCINYIFETPLLEEVANLFSSFIEKNVGFLLKNQMMRPEKHHSPFRFPPGVKPRLQSEAPVMSAGAPVSLPAGKTSDLSWWLFQQLGSANQQLSGGEGPRTGRCYMFAAMRNELALTLLICLYMVPAK